MGYSNSREVTDRDNRTRSASGHLIAGLYFAAATACLVGPVFARLGNHIEPRILGLPWSLVYVLIFIALNFAVLVWAYRRGVVDATEDDDEGGDPS